MSNRFPVARDVFDRIWRTFVQVVATAALTDGIDLQNALNLETWKTYALAGVAAVLSLIMSLIATQVGKIRGEATSASFDPEVKLQPVGASPSE